MPNTSQNATQLAPAAMAVDGNCLRSIRVLLAGLGNIGSFVAVLLAHLVASIRLVDRDTVEAHNATNQFYLPEHQGQPKADVMAEQLTRMVPELQIERRIADIEDLPWDDFSDIDVVLAGLDSLRARQILLEKTYSSNIPLIDGAVGDPMIVRVQVLLPGQACLECSWGPEQYRQLMREAPCHPHVRSNEAPRTIAPAAAGAATASLMVAQLLKLFSEAPPCESYEINGDLLAGRSVTSRRRRNEACRYHHDAPPQLIPLHVPFAAATIANVVETVRQHFAEQRVQLEFRRGILDNDLFAMARLADLEQLHSLRNRRLSDMGLTPRDRLVIRAVEPRTAHICFTSPTKG